MKRNRILIFLTFLSICFLQSNNLLAQKQLTLKDIYASNTYVQKGYGPVRWMKDNEGYSTLENDKEFGGTDIVRYDAKTNERKVLVSAKQLIPKNEKTALQISNYEWSGNDGKLLIFTNTRRVWRYNTRGDYWGIDFDDRLRLGFPPIGRN